LAELDVDSTAFKGPLVWLDEATDPVTGRVGARPGSLEKFPADRGASLTAVAALTRIFSGQDPQKEPLLQKAAEQMSAEPPVWDRGGGQVDAYYWYFGTLAMFQIGGDHWKRWNESMKQAIVDQQRNEKDRDERGSWDPVGPGAVEGGRVISTALMCLCNEVYYRYGRVFGTK
jgi:hypothetical protein